MSCCKIFWCVFALAALGASITGIVFASLKLANDPIEYSETYEAEKAICDASNYTRADGTKIVYVDPNTLGVIFPNATTVRYEKYEDECCALSPADQLEPFMEVPIAYIDCSDGFLHRWYVNRDDRDSRHPGVSKYCKVPKPYCVYTLEWFQPRPVWLEKERVRWPVAIIILCGAAVLAIGGIVLAIATGNCACCEDYNQVAPAREPATAMPVAAWEPKLNHPDTVVVIPVKAEASKNKWMTILRYLLFGKAPTI